MSASWPLSTETSAVPAEAPALAAVPDAPRRTARLLDRALAPWTPLRLAAAGALSPVMLLLARTLMGGTAWTDPRWVVAGSLAACLSALLVASYLPAGLGPRRVALRTSPAAAVAIGYLGLAGYALGASRLGIVHASFAVLVLAVALVVRTAGTRRAVRL